MEKYNIHTFKYSNDAKVRVVVLDGKPWYFAYDVAYLLGYNREYLRKPVFYFCENIRMLYPDSTVIKFKDNIVVPEDDMTELCLRSTKLTDEVWNWVEKTLLPGAQKLADYESKPEAKQATDKQPETEQQKEESTPKLTMSALTHLVTTIATRIVKDQLALAKKKCYPCIDDFSEFDGTITDDVALEELSKRMGYPILMSSDDNPMFHENVMIAYQE